MIILIATLATIAVIAAISACFRRLIQYTEDQTHDRNNWRRGA